MWSWDTQPNSHAQRKFIELILDRTGKYPNWDPPSEIPVGSYGRIDKATGNLIPQGSIYSDDFKDHLIDAGINIESGEHLPEECPEEPEFTTWSKNVKQIELNVDSQRNVPEIDTAAIKGTWQVKKGTTGAVLLMNKPRTKRITSDAVGKLATLHLFQSMRLVTKAVYCPAFSMYLSDTSGESFSIALLDSAPNAEPVGTVDPMATMRWWSDTQTGLTRNGCKTEHCYSPLYELLHVRHPRNRRATPSPIRTGEMLWIASPVPWAPLREDGTEVPIYIHNSDSSDSEPEDDIHVHSNEHL
ncbi:uncharacterized protein F5891DRAFT_1046572 [Suillus fuscotomentosus]|uniref:Uncharacterized protein n=1 Tax=Suillus fuscotomentosus TaxID=1912939 RepID=A0AAD4E209_9AGAM|nr:uncharacterized protein F5891DRAFT_1046572 [Suillus fuscotomentosus]KAG1897887.1 hypothetical protein F5891DRAFT_1046572 [Suillus fuscotomentosus]